MSDVPIEPMAKHHARQAAGLHRNGIRSGFLSSLGLRFLTQLYAAIPSCPAGFGYVATDGEEVLGFVAGTESTGRIYKQALLRRGLLMALPLLRFLVRPSVVKRMIHTLRYPSQVDPDLPPAEVLSIAVSPAARGKGIGRSLMAAAMEEFRRRGLPRVKVAVWAGNEQANRFYERFGFALASTRLHHGLVMNIYTISTDAAFPVSSAVKKKDI